MPNYDFKCKECEKLEERNVLWEERDNQICECSGKMNMQIDFSRIALICKWNTPYKPGTNAKKDRKRAFEGLEEQGKLPKNINAKNANFADLM